MKSSGQFFLSLLIASASEAQLLDPRAAQPERPTVATHAGTVAPGFLEIETGAQLDRVAEDRYGTSTPTVFKYGLGKRAQLGINAALLRPSGGTAGIGDVSAGVKWRFTDAAPLLGRVAMQPMVKFPTGSDVDGRGTGTTDVSLLLIASQLLGSVAMDLNAGYTRRGGDGTVAPKDATVWTASFGGAIQDRIGWVAELFGYPATHGPAGQESTVSLLVGPTFTARSWLVFDAGIIEPIDGPAPRSGYFGLTWNAGRL
jgi:hypothetical protein